MHSTTSHTALLVFNQTPLREALRKPSRSREVALRVFSQTKAQIIRFGQRSGLHVFDSAHWTLSGDTFAERLREAVGSILKQGFHHVLVVGIDTPGLTQEHLVHASAILSEGHLPVGPDQRGGAYLLAFDANLWASTIWDICRWETPHFLQDWQSATSAFSLHSVADIASTPDFDWVKTMIRFRWMLKALSQQVRLDGCLTRIPPAPKPSYHGLRAPPKETILF